MQHATERVERPGESQEALDGKKLRGLRAGCTSLGLSTRGSKKDCIEFFKTRELVEAQAVEAKLK